MHSRGRADDFEAPREPFPMIDMASQACYRYSSRENWKTGGGLNSSGSCAAVALSENAITGRVSTPRVDLGPATDPEACIRGQGEKGVGRR